MSEQESEAQAEAARVIEARRARWWEAPPDPPSAAESYFKKDITIQDPGTESR